MEAQLQEQVATATLIAPGKSEIVYRTGKAEEIKEPNRIAIVGDINAVSDFLLQRYTKKNATQENPQAAIVYGKGLQYVDFEKAMVLVDKDNATPSIMLQLDPENYYGATVKGELQISKEVKLFGLNEPTEYTRETLISLFRFNKIHFAKPEKCDELVKALQKFSVSAFVALSKEDDSRGNLNASVTKKVDSSGIPLTFVLNIPIYKGQQKEEIEVDICLDVNGQRVDFWFESVQLVELLEQRKNEIFEKQLADCLDFPIIHK